LVVQVLQYIAEGLAAVRRPGGAFGQERRGELGVLVADELPGVEAAAFFPSADEFPVPLVQFYLLGEVPPACQDIVAGNAEVAGDVGYELRRDDGLDDVAALVEGPKLLSSGQDVPRENGGRLVAGVNVFLKFLGFITFVRSCLR